MKIALAGDTMLGRGVAERLTTATPGSLFSDELVEITRSADLFFLNLECCISNRGEPLPQPGKPFFFRAPPRAVETLVHLGVDCVTLANNHALDFGRDALIDTFEHLRSAGIGWVGAGRDLDEARSVKTLKARDGAISVLAVTDHPRDFAAIEDRAGVAFADLRRSVPTWLREAIEHHRTDVLILLPHWGPNMNPQPLGYVRTAGDEFLRRGATLVAGHSAHVFQGIGPRILYDLGDLIDDYATDPILRNDLGCLWLVDLDEPSRSRVEAIPLKLDYCYTRRARNDDWDWIARRLAELCHPFGTEVQRVGDRLALRPAS